jgi:hypothetical protein
VGPGLLYQLLLLFRFFIMNFVLRVRCFSVYSALYLSFLYLVERNTIVTRFVPQILRQQYRTLPRSAIILVSIWPPANKTDCNTMPPRRGTPWVSHGSLLSDRIRPPSGSPQPTKSEKGKGKAKAPTPEPPPRSAAVRKLDELLDGLRSSSTSNQQQPKNETGKVTTALSASAYADREGCFCQGTSAFFPSCTTFFLPFFKFSLCLSFVFPQSIIFIQLELYIYIITICSPNTRIIRIHSHLLVLRSRPLRPTTSIPSLSTLQHTAPHASRTGSALGAAR